MQHCSRERQRTARIELGEAVEMRACALDRCYLLREGARLLCVNCGQWHPFCPEDRESMALQNTYNRLGDN